MSRTLFRQIPPGSKLLAVGNFFRKSSLDDRWRLGAIFERDEEPQLQRFSLETACILAVGREFPGEDGAPYRLGGFKKTLVLPAISTWQEKSLGSCPRLQRRLAANPEIFGQRCFVFETNGVTVWMPKFELARKLFFHAAFMARAAFEPNGLDMIFTIYKNGGDYHIHTPAKTGAPSRLLRIKEYRDHFSWLLLSQDVRRSFDSIWSSLNQEQEGAKKNSVYARWKFNFQPYASLAGVRIDVRGAFDSNSNQLLIWEIEKLTGLRFSHHGDIYFHHPSFKLPASGQGAGRVPAGPGGGDVEVDVEEDPADEQDVQLIHLPLDSIVIDGRVNTKISYDGERARSNGRRVDDIELSSGEIKTVGVADPVSGGGIAPGEFQNLAGVDSQERFVDRFSQLREIIEQISEESDLVLIKLEVKPLPPVQRCSYHMIDGTTPRCYLLAKFRLENGCDRYLLEMDTSDNRKPMSTRIFGFQSEVDVDEGMHKILKETVKGSLRWPSSMAKLCEPLHAVHHPKESSSGANESKVLDWKLRISLALRE